MDIVFSIFNIILIIKVVFFFLKQHEQFRGSWSQILKPKKNMKCNGWIYFLNSISDKRIVIRCWLSYLRRRTEIQSLWFTDIINTGKVNIYNFYSIVQSVAIYRCWILPCLTMLCRWTRYLSLANRIPRDKYVVLSLTCVPCWVDRLAFI